MKAGFKYLSFIGTALVMAASSTPAFAQTNFSDSVCSYTPQNRHCIGLNMANRMNASSRMMSQPSTNYPSQMDNSRSNSGAMDSNRMSTPSSGAMDSNRMSTPSSTNQNTNSGRMRSPNNSSGAMDSNGMSTPSSR
jgi:hypothetical protein